MKKTQTLDLKTEIRLLREHAAKCKPIKRVLLKSVATLAERVSKLLDTFAV